MISLPEGMRPSTLDERRKFYSEEFDLKKAEKWFKQLPFKTRPLFAAIMGKISGIYDTDYSAKDAKMTLLLDRADSQKKLKADLMAFLPESVYYSRSFFRTFEKSVDCNKFKGWGCSDFLGQELAIDIDPENFGNRNSESFSEENFEKAKKETLELYDYLDFSKKKITYSGRGFHIHVFDRDVFLWSREKRAEFSKKLTKEGFMHDEWVASGEFYLIRLPYSLHAVTSRICIPVKKSELYGFNPLRNRKTRPRFLGRW